MTGLLPSLMAIVPVRDEEDSIAAVVEELRRHGVQRCRVVDNGSRDGSAEAARRAGAEVLSEPVPGYGQACRRGLQDLPDDVEWLLFCDGDGSDDLSPLPQLLREAEAGADLVSGNRLATAAGRAALSPAQLGGNRLATALIRLGWGGRCRDLGPLRLIRRSALEQLPPLDRGFGWMVEMQVRALEAGWRIAELSVPYRQRRAGHSKISGRLRGVLLAGGTILLALARLWCQRVRARWRAGAQRLAAWSSGLLPLWAGLLLLGAWLVRGHGGFLAPGGLGLFWSGAALMGAGFAGSWALQRPGALPYWGVALLARLLLLGMEPSDDIWRYLWEGHIQNAGISPYALAPDAPELEGLRTLWWDRINHPGTSAIYPPLTQLLFRLVAALSTSVLAFKLLVLAADLAVCRLLTQRWGRASGLLYSWNPLVLVAFAGEGHLDSLLLLAMVLAWQAWDSRRPVAAALATGAGLALKWVSAPLALFVLLRGPTAAGPRWRMVAALALPFLLTLPLACGLELCVPAPLQSRFVQNGRSAELIPALVGLVLPASRAANWPWALAFAVVLALLLLRCRRFEGYAEGSLSALLMLSPIVHAWYATWLMPFAVATGNLGSRLLSLSVFSYYWLREQQLLGDLSWNLPPLLRLALWGPFLLGLVLQRCWPGRPGAGCDPGCVQSQGAGAGSQISNLPADGHRHTSGVPQL
ncbi:glycosyltransferase family 2 protein [Synechococcus sp. RSCCF101]|uniref:glycosyltransferase family 2 protein n=1 Tax=Synechococcus sp. RSCCF101 TaxID=2511069 RepID=UPI001CD98ABB|nr:glycosyltransferase family 2 protein [Synechococcus sp. RSCCF101]